MHDLETVKEVTRALNSRAWEVLKKYLASKVKEEQRDLWNRFEFINQCKKEWERQHGFPSGTPYQILV